MISRVLSQVLSGILEMREEKKAEMIEVSVKQHSERKCWVTKVSEEIKNIVKVRIN